MFYCCLFFGNHIDELDIFLTGNYIPISVVKAHVNNGVPESIDQVICPPRIGCEQVEELIASRFGNNKRRLC